MRAIVNPGSISGAITAPSSKSMTQRALAIALLQKGVTTIHFPGNSDDEKSAITVIQQLGAKITNQTPISLEITSNGINPITNIINCGESGLAARLFTPIAALASSPVSITGYGTLLKRPMYGFNQALNSLGISVSGFNGYLPVTVHGPLESISFRLSAANGSQFLSGLLLAISYSAKGLVTIEVADLKSKPYIDMTLEILALAGKPIRHDNYTSFYIDPTLFTPKQNLEMTIEGDWSGAANFLVAGAITGEISVNNLQTTSHQADTAIITALRLAGATVEEQGNCITVKKAPLQGFEFDATHCPDLFPILSILAANCAGESYIKGIHRLHDKESNRVESIAEMLQNFDVPFSIEDDSFCITGVRVLQGTVIDTFNDHRIAMAASVGALRANGPVDIIDADAVNKSYPNFFGDLSLCGVNWTEQG
jgi:3-phosphoshikimate 1-carboxyvinyltransferase